MDLSALIPLLVGWALGLISHPLVEFVNWRIKCKRFKKALGVELEELRRRLAGHAFSLVRRFGAFDTQFVGWYSTIVRSYKEQDSQTEEIKLLDNLEKLSDEELAAWQQIDRARGLSFSIKKHHLPYLTSQVSLLSGFSLDLQRKLIGILTQLEFLHEEIDQVNTHLNRTFDPSISVENYEINDENIRSSYRIMGNLSKDLADRIEAVLKQLVA